MDTARKTMLMLLCLLLMPDLGHALPEVPVTLPGKTVQWVTLEDGMENAQLSYTVQKGEGYVRRVTLHALRLDASRFSFSLYSAGWEDGKARTMREWTEEKELSAAINACMYQTDGLNKYGAFFVSGPRREGLPQAALLDRTSDDWQSLLPLYENVVQNFRLMGRQGEQLWPENGPRHAVAAVAEDSRGRLLFLLCTEPVSVHDFVDALNAHPGLELKTAMYAEGGSDAALMVRSEGRTRLLNGLSPAGYMLSARGDDIPLPNIIGVKRR